MRINKKVLGYCIVGVVVTLVVIVLALPPLIRYFAVKKIDEATGRKSQIAKVSLNPFNLTAEVSGVRLSEKGSKATFFSLSSARLSLSPLSLPKRSFIIKEIHLASPYLHVLRDAPYHYNFSDLLTPKKEEKKKEEGAYLFSLNNIIIKNGGVDFQDRALKEAKDHHISNMAVSVPFISNMPYLADRYVTPHFSAVINGSAVRFDGRLKPLTRAVEASVGLKVKDVNLPFYLGYLPTPLPVNVVSGRLTTALELGYRVDEKTGPDLRLSGNVALDGPAVKEQTGAPLAAMDRAELQIRNALLLSKVIDISSLQLEGMDLTASRDRAGVWNFQRITGKGNPPAAPEAAPPPAERKGEKARKPLDLRLAKLSLNKGKIHLSDRLPKEGFKTELRDIDLTVTDLSLAQGQKAPLDLKLKTARGESASIKGDLVVKPLDFRGTVALTGIPLKDYYPYLTETLTAPVSGKVALSSQVAYNEKSGVLLEKGVVKGEGISAPFGEGEGVRLRGAEISGIALDLKRNKAVVQRVDLRGGNVVLSSNKGGGMSYQRLLRASKPAAGETAAGRRKRVARKEKAAPPFTYRVERVTGNDFGIRFTDRANEEEPVFTLNGLKFALSGITGPKLGVIPLTLSSGYGGKGRIAANGHLTAEPLKFRGNVELHGIPLRDFDPYIPEDTNIFIVDGALDTNLALNLEKVAAGFKGSFGGSLGVRSFYCQDTTYDEDLLKWERLQMDRISGTLAPFTLAIKDIALSNFYSRVIIEKDGTLNLQHLKEPPETAAAPAAPAPAAQATPVATTIATNAAVETALKKASTGPPPASIEKPSPAAAGAPGKGEARQPGAQSAPPQMPVEAAQREAARTAFAPKAVPAGGESAAQPHPIRIDAITMQGGTLHFTDRHLETPFDTTFYNLGGRVSGLTSEAHRVADVDLRGNLENHSPLAITGVINPLRGDLFLDMKIAFTDIELSPFTPYSNTYLGYGVDKGKLNLDLVYKIDKKALSSQNKVFIDQFTFGKQVDSPQATKLPVRLAIALLKDRKGEIHLDLPVAGRTDDPKFSVWKVVWQILKNLLVKAATSPVALLGSMFGGHEDFSSVSFAPGSDQLAKPEQEKLTKLAKALQERPALNLEISGFVDREPDTEGYRNEVLSKKMKGEKFRKLVKEGKVTEGQTPEGIEILPQEYPVYLKAVYLKEKFPKPRNFVGMLKDLPDAEMKKLIITHTVVGNNELQALARERAERVKGFLIKEGKVPAERLFEKGADIYKPSEKGGPASRVEFGASVK